MVSVIFKFYILLIVLGSISSYLEDLKNFDLFEKYGVEEIIEFTFLVVKHTHTRQGIAKVIVFWVFDMFFFGGGGAHSAISSTIM